jgi:hypothetical protein
LRVCRNHDLSEPNTITFIFLWPINDIDFLRRFGECWQRWVVSDIKATIGLTVINGFSQAAVSDRQSCELGLQHLDQMLLGRDLAAAMGKP